MSGKEPVIQSGSEREVVPLVASIDVGTTSSRVILFNKLGQEISKHQIEYSTSASQQAYSASGERNLDEKRRPSSNGSDNEQPIFSAEGIAIEATEYLEIEDLENNVEPTLRFPRPGWVECKPVNILENVVQCFAANLISMDRVNGDRVSNGLPPYRIKCVGIANMRETTLVWSKKTGIPLIDYGIVWNDVRTTEIVQKKKDETSEEYQRHLREMTGLPLFSTYFSCSKLRWLLDNVPAVSKAYEENDLVFGTVDTWLIFNLTHNHVLVTDVTNACRTGFMNLSTKNYDDELLKYWNIDKEKIHLPKIVSSSEYYGNFVVPKCTKKTLTPTAWDLLTSFSNRTPPVPIQGCLGDQSASLVGQLAFKPGSAKCTYGTGCFLLYNTGTTKLISNHGALTTFAYWFPNLHNEDDDYGKPHYALEGSVAVAGAVVQWLRDNLRLFPRAEDVGPLASAVPDSGGVVFVPAFSGLFAPYWDPDARATIMGMSQYTTASHIARAAVEGVCYQARAILKAMSSDAFGSDNKDFLEEVVDETYEKTALSSLAVDGGMSRSDEVMQIQADILGPCVKVRRSPTSECTALGAAIAAAMAFESEEERIIWKNLKDVKKWVYYGGFERGETVSSNTTSNSNLKVFSSKSSNQDRRKGWKMWETAIERCKGWISDIQIS
ncbi:unnamed protein product [Kluyveromyces dobzhanskii CBS 2104]|uniref:glycerol kinase n=1 Tax=Kluyveromyces dobzhanskii CBS 2104 TaxID=1427455 RepID=A0A0A8L4X9_9SACH|nr:unnamed protein product [Kluyveromyces dobzhanskii CBS 2104]